MSKKVLLHSKLCELDELTCLVCAVDENEKRDKSAPSIFHHKILKCRLLIFSASEILASPDYKSDFIIFVIFNRKVTNNVKFLEHIDRINLKIIKTAPVDLSTYEACLKYTLITKIAPSWNHVQPNFLIKGRDFLSNSNSSDAVALNIFVFENAVVLEIECVKMKLNSIRNKDLDIVQKKMDYFNEASDSSIRDQFLFKQWIHVLPSLKQGVLISVNRTIPKSSLFENYRDLKRHWKNCYGYRLPDDESGIVYYEVHFMPLGPQLYTYPSTCLLTNYPIQTTPAPKSINEITESFKTDMNKAITHILGHNVHFDELDLKYVNDSADYVPSNTVQVLKLNKILCDNRINMNHKDSLMKVEQNEISYEEMESIKLVLLENEHSSSMNNIADETCFSQNLSFGTPVQNSGTVEKYKPIFTPKNKKEIPANENYLEYKLPKTINKSNYLCDLKIENNYSDNKVKPEFLPKNDFNYLESSANKKRNFDGILIENNNKQNEKNNTSLSQIIKPEYNMSGFETSKIQKISIDDVDKAYSKNITHNGNFGNCTPNNKQNLSSIQPKSAFNQHNQNNQNLSSQQQPNTSKKIITSVPKTINHKIKENIIDACVTIDISSMAKTNFDSLNKLTVRTLFLWLRSQNVHVTTKMVKKQLLDKIREHLNL